MRQSRNPQLLQKMSLRRLQMLLHLLALGREREGVVRNVEVTQSLNQRIRVREKW